MVSQRQREARKKFKQENPELFPKAEPTPPADPTKKKKRRQPTFKKKKADPSAPKTQTPHKSSSSSSLKTKRHPLRVPGLKPGDGCFICKATNHVAKDCPEKAIWEKNKICLQCRQRGHTLKRCPNKGDETLDKKICYNCGEKGHSLSDCTLPPQEGGTKFASCFICNEQGHLSKNCPKNSHGVYPKGGSCKVCGGVTHLAKDCPEKGKRAFSERNLGVFPESQYASAARGRVTKLVSGDDLEDDFMMDDDPQADDQKQPSKSKDAQVKPKTKQGPKVVNF